MNTAFVLLAGSAPPLLALFYVLKILEEHPLRYSAAGRTVYPSVGPTVGTIFDKAWVGLPKSAALWG